MLFIDIEPLEEIWTVWMLKYCDFVSSPISFGVMVRITRVHVQASSPASSSLMILLIDNDEQKAIVMGDVFMNKIN